MDPELPERITARRAELDELEEQLAKQLTEVRAERDELAVAERVLERKGEQLADERASAAPTPGQVGGRAVILTGHRRDAADALYTGLAMHFIPANRLDAVADALADDVGIPVDTALECLGQQSPVGDRQLEKVRGELDWAFGVIGVAGIRERLHCLDSPWAVATRDTLDAVSPQSLRIAHALLTAGRQRTVRECLDADLRLAQSTIRPPGFLERVRAALVDKDRTPLWKYRY
ncbi:enoyl-CoA hydratase/isomerase family protein [Streptomyces sp. NPDC015032]|uniref:enoyl-CoA hydratase/isomerase family protein n=1 Tax=Streptomyces sp. NPDC015032 TaxID=3364937 RepID=UPI003701BDB6